MNETLEVLMKRKSVRVFEPKPIGPQEKQAILAAAMRAPTAGNSMLYSILDVTDQDLKDKLAVTATISLLLLPPRWCWSFWQIIAAGCGNFSKPDVKIFQIPV